MGIEILMEELEDEVEEISQKIELKTRDVNARGKRKQIKRELDSLARPVSK